MNIFSSKSTAGTASQRVVVLGAGLAGHVAALEAADYGAEVLLIDKANELGGSTVLSGGSFAFAGTDMQLESQVQDNPEGLRRDLLEVGGEQCDARLVDLYVRGQLDAYEWMQSLGVEFQQVSLSSNQSAPRSHGVKIRSAFGTLHRAVEASPSITVHTGHTPMRILTEDDVVVGVELLTPSGDIEVPASAVILATGGFSRGKRMVESFLPRLKRTRRMGGQENTGEGLYLAMAIGGDLKDLGSVKATFGVTADVSGMPAEPTLLISLYHGGIIVNTDAHRFVDESLSYKILADFCLAQPQGVGIQIFDQNVMDQTIPEKAVNDFAGAMKRGYLWKSDNLSDLAEQAGLDAEALESTVKEYNRGVSNGFDLEFGRTNLGRDFGERTLISQAPYYAYPSTGGLISTYGGLHVDDCMRVQHVLGGKIPGLYAAGEIVGGFHGEGYMSGSSLGKSVVFGRTAGENAAQFANRSN